QGTHIERRSALLAQSLRPLERVRDLSSHHRRIVLEPKSQRTPAPEQRKSMILFRRGAQHVESENREHLDVRIRMPLHMRAETLALCRRAERRRDDEAGLCVFKAAAGVLDAGSPRAA